MSEISLPSAQENLPVSECKQGTAATTSGSPKVPRRVLYSTYYCWFGKRFLLVAKNYGVSSWQLGKEPRCSRDARQDELLGSSHWPRGAATTYDSCPSHTCSVGKVATEAAVVDSPCVAEFTRCRPVRPGFSFTIRTGTRLFTPALGWLVRMILTSTEIN